MIQEIIHGIAFRSCSCLLLLFSLQNNYGMKDWRPIGAVPVPRQSYFMTDGGKRPKDGDTLWRLMNNFMIKKHKGAWVKVHPENCDEVVRSMDDKRSDDFIRAGCQLILSQYHDGNYSLRSHIPGKGGGPICGMIAYWATKTLCYGVATAAAGTAVVATGGAVGAVTGVLATAGTLGASTGVTLVAGAISGAGLATEAVTLTTATIATGGGIAGAITTVELASTAVGGFFAAMPFLP